jgi:1-aminocyclopropane-1-carboxylate deaminase/D-cysteine desulfhydrase-like pyridoxal-dependent ACC family enzyme
MREIDRLPRVQLGHLPTPLEAAPRLGESLGLNQLWIKRDDLTGLALGGNKARKLEYILGEAVAEGADTLITSAGLQSNRARMTAAACRRVGLECVLLLCSNYGVNAPIGNLMLDEVFGADIRFSTAPDSYSEQALAEAEDIAAELAQVGRRAYLTDVGRRPEPLGEVGYYVGALELVDQCRAAGMAFNPDPGAVLLACGSGSQQAGVLVGLRALGLATRVIGISLQSETGDRPAVVAHLAQQLAEWLGLGASVQAQDVVVDDHASAAGHGPPDAAAVAAVRLAAQREGLLLDPIYMGKVVAAVPDLLRRGLISADQPVVIWHTGGAPAIFMHTDAFSRTASLAAVG